MEVKFYKKLQGVDNPGPEMRHTALNQQLHNWEMIEHGNEDNLIIINHSIASHQISKQIISLPVKGKLTALRMPYSLSF